MAWEHWLCGAHRSSESVLLKAIDMFLADCFFPAVNNPFLFSLPSHSLPTGPGTGRVDNGSMSLAVPLWLLAVSLLCLLSKC